MLPEHIKDAITRDIPLMEGWLCPERGLEMAELILDTRPQVVVEIGVFGGRSLVSQGLALKEIGEGKIYGIDAWKREVTYEGESEANKDWWAKVDMNDIHRKAMEALWNHGLDEFAIVLRCASQFCHDLFPAIDIIYIDGCHSEVASCRDVELYLPNVVQGGWLWLDDVDWVSTKKAQAMVEEKCDVMKDGGTYRLYRKRFEPSHQNQHHTTGTHWS